MNTVHPVSAVVNALASDGPVRSAALSPSRRIVRAALALVERTTAQAGETHRPLVERISAVRQADEQLGAAWRAAMAWPQEPGADLQEVARASALIGAHARRLPLLAASLRAAAGAPLSVEKDDAPASSERATLPCPPPVPYRALVAAVAARRAA